MQTFALKSVRELVCFVQVRLGLVNCHSSLENFFQLLTSLGCAGLTKQSKPYECIVSNGGSVHLRKGFRMGVKLDCGWRSGLQNNVVWVTLSAST